MHRRATGSPPAKVPLRWNALSCSYPPDVFPVKATQILLLPGFAEHGAEIHSDSERNRIQSKMHAAAVTQFEIESADRIHIQRRAETIVADQTGAARGFGGVLKHPAVPHHPAGPAGSRCHKPAENLLLAPGRDIVGRSPYAHRVAQIILRSRFEVRHCAKGHEGPLKETRVVKGVAYAKIGERSPPIEFPGKVIAPIERRPARAKSLLCIAGRRSAGQRGDVVHGGILERQPEIREDVAQTTVADLGAGGSCAAREKDGNAQAPTEMLIKSISGRGGQVHGLAVGI